MSGATLIGAVASVMARSDYKPGQTIPVACPGDIYHYRAPEPQHAPGCEGCGAPGVHYTHHCEYCKRPR